MNHKSIKEHSVVAEKSWGGSYDILWPILKKKKLHIGAEVGVAFGGHSERILKKTQVKLYCIDPYRHIDGYDDDMNMSNEKFDQLYMFTKKRLSVFGNRCKMIRKDSIHATDSIKEELDFVYIDGDHSEEGIRQDLIAWYPKIRDGGIVSGHDYGHSGFPGVKKIVDEFFVRFNWKIHFHKSGVWWVEKSPLPITYIMPAYNCSKTIMQSVISIYDGNYQVGDEFIIVDDASTDSTPKVLSKISKKYPNIKIISHKFNKGGGGARNTAVEHATNELIFCLDSDNILHKNSVSKLKENLLLSISDASSFQEIRYFNKTIHKITNTWSFSNHTYTSQNYLTTGVVPGSSGNYLFTKNSWVEAGRYSEDSFMDTWSFGLRQVMSGSVISVLPNSYYFHRVGHNSYWVRESLRKNTSIEALTHLLKYYKLLKKNDIKYLMSKNREVWLNNLDKRPIIPSRHEKKNIQKLMVIFIKKVIKFFQT